MYSIYTLLSVWFLSLYTIFVRVIYDIAYSNSSFSLLYNYNYKHPIYSSLLLLDIWVASSLGLMPVMLLW